MVYIFGNDAAPNSSKINTKKLVLRDGSNKMLGTLNMGDNKIYKVINLEDSQDVATKEYVDKNSIPRIQNPQNKILI